MQRRTPGQVWLPGYIGCCYRIQAPQQRCGARSHPSVASMLFSALTVHLTCRTPTPSGCGPAGCRRCDEQGQKVQRVRRAASSTQRSHIRCKFFTRCARACPCRRRCVPAALHALLTAPSAAALKLSNGHTKRFTARSRRDCCDSSSVLVHSPASAHCRSALLLVAWLSVPQVRACGVRALAAPCGGAAPRWRMRRAAAWAARRRLCHALRGRTGAAAARAGLRARMRDGSSARVRAF